MKIYTAYLHPDMYYRLSEFLRKYIMCTNFIRHTNQNLFAYTNDNNIMKLFKKYHRKDLFIYDIEYMDKKEYTKLTWSSGDKELKYYDLPITVDNPCYTNPLPLTKLQYSIINYESIQWMSEFLSLNLKINPDIFNSHCSFALQNIGYIYDYCQNFDDEQKEDAVYYNASYFPETSIIQLMMNGKVPAFNIYIILFHELMDLVKLHEII